MHLAICDDHMADRKQMERLLGRESDRRLNTTGVLYVDSFGSKESILTTPMIYDAILRMVRVNCKFFSCVLQDACKRRPVIRGKWKQDRTGCTKPQQSVGLK